MSEDAPPMLPHAMIQRIRKTTPEDAARTFFAEMTKVKQDKLTFWEMLADA